MRVKYDKLKDPRHLPVLAIDKLKDIGGFSPVIVQWRCEPPPVGKVFTRLHYRIMDNSHTEIRILSWDDLPIIESYYSSGTRRVRVKDTRTGMIVLERVP